MGKMAGITSTGLLLLPPDLVKDKLVIQFPHISINVSGHMGEAATRVLIVTPRHLGTRTSPKWRAGLTVATTDARNNGVGRYQM